jgi:hypothetical protein
MHRRNPQETFHGCSHSIAFKILDEIREKTTRYNDIAIPTFEKWLAERINISIYEMFFAGQPPGLDFLF